MCIRSRAALIFAVNCACFASNAADSDVFSHQTLTTTCTAVAGTSMSYGLRDFAFIHEPEWDPDSGTPPPLSRNEAVAIARRVLPEDTGQARNWKLTKIELKSACCPKRWYYLTSWLPEGRKGDPLEIPVLMSGKPGELMFCVGPIS